MTDDDRVQLNRAIADHLRGEIHVSWAFGEMRQLTVDASIWDEAVKCDAITRNFIEKDGEDLILGGGDRWRVRVVKGTVTDDA